MMARTPPFPPFSSDTYPARSLRGRRVTILGLGLFGGGTALARYLAGRGALLTVTDRRSRKDLEVSLRELEDLPIRYVLGKHREEDFVRADIVFVNPAVAPGSPLIESAHRAGVPLDSEMNLFLKLCRVPVLAVTGSNGKSTTVALAGAMIRRSGRRVWVGGNIGRSLLSSLHRIRADDRVVVEISSFQLEHLRALPLRPAVSVLTTVTPNHLDYHGTFARYASAKRVILDPGPPPNIAILPGGDDRLLRWARDQGRKVIAFARRPKGTPSVWIEGSSVRSDLSGAERELFTASDLRLPGRFNLENAAAAAAAAAVAGAKPSGIREGVIRFRPIPHRLEEVGRIDSVSYYNDSIATTPESTVAALDALAPGVLLIAGGSDKGIPFRRLGRVIARRAKAVVLIGATAPGIQASIRAAPCGRAIPLLRRPDLPSAVEAARQLASSGDKVLLSPASASFDMFRNFQERGETFRAIVRRMARGRAPRKKRRS